MTGPGGSRARGVAARGVAGPGGRGPGGSPAGARPTFLKMGSNSWPVYRPVSGRHSSDVLPMSLRYPCGIRQGADQFLQAVRRPDGHLMRWAAFYTLRAPMSGRFPAGRRKVGRTPGRRLSGVWAAPGRRMADTWIVWVVQNLAWRPPDVCDALPDIGQASADLLAISLRCETPHQVLSPS